ncbi:hypothetical protein GCM10018955_44940 [Planomonospora venezuelensis]
MTPDDPHELAGYRITGRFDDVRPEGAYLAEDPSGAQVTIRLLPPGADPERFLRAVEPLRGVSASGVAQVLGGGLHGDRPYLVSEHVEGATLAESVAADGTPRGAALDRLAIGTMAALAAVHRAGAVHGDVRPETVVLGPDGPIVVDFGLVQALGTVDSGPTRSVGLPAYQAPEQLDGSPPGPPADVFAWAATMVFAATGTAPFAGGTVAATINRVLRDEPDLADIPGELGAVLSDCLAKDPAVRPAANAVLLRLIGESSLLEAATAIATGQVAAPPTRSPGMRAGRVLLLAGAFLAVAAASGAAVYLTAPPPGPRAAVAPPSPGGSLAPALSASPGVTTTARPTAAVWEKVEKPNSEVKLDGTSITVHEHPSDPVKIVSYLLTKRPFTSYLRERSGTFRKLAPGDEVVPSPDGTLVALHPWLKFLDSDHDQVKLSRPSTGEQFTVTTVKQPLQTIAPVWSRDGSRLLLSILDRDKELISGFVLIDPASRTATAVETEYIDDISRPFAFMPDGRIARGFSDGKRIGVNVYDTTGRVVRSMHWVGNPLSTTWFSPSGAVFATICPKNDGTFCVWNTKTGDRRATVPAASGAHWAGWFNEQHVILQVPHKKGTRFQIVDLTGTVVRVLADVPDGNEAFLRFDRVTPR